MIYCLISYLMSSRWQNYNSVCMEKCIYAPVYMCVTCILYIFLSMCQKYCVVTDIEKRLMAIVGGRRGCGIWSESEVAQSCSTLCKPMDSSLHQAPPSMGFSRQEYWSGLPFPSPENLSNPGMKPGSPALQVDSLPSEPPVKTLTAESKGIDMAVKREFVFISLTFQKIERETTIENLT